MQKLLKKAPDKFEELRKELEDPETIDDINSALAFVPVLDIYASLLMEAFGIRVRKSGDGSLSKLLGFIARNFELSEELHGYLIASSREADRLSVLNSKYFGKLELQESEIPGAEADRSSMTATLLKLLAAAE
jgi:hypothetical protein